MMGPRDGITGLPDAILQHEGRLSAAEQAIRERVSHEKLNHAINGLNKDVSAKIEASERHTGDKIDKLDAQNEKRLTALQLQLTQAFQAMAESAAEKAVEKQRLAEKKAREEVDQKAKDAVRGVARLMWAVGPLCGGAAVVAVYLFAKHVLGWSL